MKVEYINRENGRLLLKCDMDVIPRVGENIVIKGHGDMKVTKVRWWISSPSDKHVRINVKPDPTISKLKNLRGTEI